MYVKHSSYLCIVKLKQQAMNMKKITYSELYDFRKENDLTIEKLMTTKGLKVCCEFSEYKSVVEKDNTIILNAIDLIKKLGGECLYKTNNDMTDYLYSIIDYDTLKSMVKQDTYKDMFRGFKFFLFQWSISDWRDCQLSIPQLVYYYPTIANKLFNLKE